MRRFIVLVLLSCATTPVVTTPSTVEGLVRRTVRPCGGRFSFATPPAAVAGRTFTLRLAEKTVATFTTSDEGAFRAALPRGRYCVVEGTEAGACVTTFEFDPRNEPVPVIVLPATPCP